MNRRKVDEWVIVLIIHAFTVAHAVVAGFLGPFAGATLTPMTIAMITVIGWICGASFGIKTILKRWYIFLAQILGVGAAEFFLGLFPGLGNLANAAASAIITEYIGWAIFIYFRDELDKNDSVDVKDLFEKAKYEADNHRELMEQMRKAVEAMSMRDKKQYKKYMKTIRSKNVSERIRQDAIFNAKLLMEKYGVRF